MINFEKKENIKFSFAKNLIRNPNCGEVQIYKYFSDSVGKLKAFLGKFSPIHFLVQFADTLSRSLQGKSHY